MSKFATKAREASPNTVNRAGGAAYTIKDTRKDLASVVLASMLKKDSYYSTDEQNIQNVFDLVASLPDKSFAAKAMIYARQEGNLRSISHVLANSLVENNDGSYSIKNAIKKAIVRPDDLTEMAALYFSRHPDKMLPNSMRRAFKEMLESNKWDSYQLKKYLKSKASVKLRDIVLLTHPKDKRGLLKGVVDGTIQAPKTLESKLASGEKASKAIGEMLSENRLGYMAAIKNIRNALSTDITDQALDAWCKLVSDPRRVAKSRMLPFRFVDAWFAVKDMNLDHFKLQKVKDTLNAAITASAQNLEFVNSDEKIALIIDESGSMGGRGNNWYGDNNGTDAWDHAIILVATLYTAFPRGNVVVYKFGSNCTKLDFGTKSPLEIIETTQHSGGATYFHAPFAKLFRTGTVVDKAIMLTDMQLYSAWGNPEGSFDKYFNQYKRTFSPKMKFLFWNLESYGGETPLELKNDILLASGFSDKLLKVIPGMWKNENALVEEIEKIVI